MNESKYILEIKGVFKSYYRSIKNEYNTNEIESNVVLDGIDLAVEKGKITSLIGGNGTGKTTLLNIISGFTSKDRGIINYHIGKTYLLSNMMPYSISRLGIGRMFQDVHIFKELSIMGNMLLADNQRTSLENPISSIFLSRKIRRSEKLSLEKAQNIFHLLFEEETDLLNQFLDRSAEQAGNLSYGQQRLLGLAQLFMSDNKLILLDEPTSGIHTDLIKHIAKTIKKLVANNDASVIMIEHNLEFMSAISDHCAFLNNGKIQFTGTPKQVLNEEEVKKSYLEF